jgi:hypothetical protein
METNLKEAIINCNDINILLQVKSELSERISRNKPYRPNNKWMHPFHKPFEDNSNFVKAQINSDKNLIELINDKILILTKS